MQVQVLSPALLQRKGLRRTAVGPFSCAFRWRGGLGVAFEITSLHPATLRFPGGNPLACEEKTLSGIINGSGKLNQVGTAG